MSGAYLNLPPVNSRRAGSRFAILQAPYDATSTWKKGADRGPQAILDASAHLELYDIETDTEAYRAGIYTHEESLDLSSPQRMVDSVEQLAAPFYREGMIPVLLGGEHSVTLGAVRAAHAAHPDLAVLQLDAHTDLRAEYEGSPYNHACVMARVSEICPIVQVGIRSMDLSEKSSVRKGRIFYARDIVHDTAWIDRVVGLLPEEVYLTFDLDVLDPSIMPSTGTPEPGGLGWYDCMRLLRRLARSRRIIGFDIVELCPGAQHAPDFLAAKLVYKVMSYIHSSDEARRAGAAPMPGNP